MESEKEYKITIKSVVNIHDPAHVEKITSAFMGHQVRKVEADRIIPFTGKIDKELPEAPVGLPIYTVNVVIGMKMGQREIEELLALYTGIEKMYFCVYGDIEKLDETKIETIADLDTSKEVAAQDQVGQKRIDDFMAEMKKARKERDTKIKTRPVYEAFCVGADELRPLIRESLVSRGYWMVRSLDESKKRLSITGPYTNIPVGLAMVEGLVRNMKSTTRPMMTNHGDLVEYVLDLTDARWALMEDRPYEVRVKDTSTGRTYTAAVRATDSLQARNLGLEQVKSEEGISGDTLLALNPTD